jgi:hypothetical protein
MLLAVQCCNLSWSNLPYSIFGAATVCFFMHGSMNCYASLSPQTLFFEAGMVVGAWWCECTSVQVCI